MPPPRKRPRLHFVGSSSPEPDVELATARQRNDDLLKTRWEAVFQRYERDFTGVGDEIGQLSGRVEVDNGHLRSMQNERDVGQPPELSSSFDGRRMLRAMTVAPSDYSDSIPEAEEVLQSIETMADNAMLSDYSSEDDLFDPDSDPTESGHGLQDDELEQHGEQDYAVESSDDLFDTGPNMRLPSVDSFFQEEVPIVLPREHSVPELDPGTSATPLSHSHGTHESSIREQVRRILQEERAQEKEMEEERVEPAWRLPIHLTSHSYSRPVSAGLPRIASTGNSPAEDVDEDNISAEVNTSIWKASDRLRRSRREVVAERNLKRIRAESEDPLQEGFSSESEESSIPSSARQSTQPSLRYSIEKHTSRPHSSNSSVPPSPPPPVLETPLTHAYNTRRSLRQRLSLQRASSITSPVQSKTASITEISTSVKLPIARQRNTDSSRTSLPRAAVDGNSEDDYEDESHRSADQENKVVLSASSPGNPMAVPEANAEVEQPEDTIVVHERSRSRSNDTASSRNDIPNTPQLYGTTSGRRRRRKAPLTPCISHPWETKVSQSGQPMSNLSKSLRRGAGQKYKNRLTKLSDGTDIATFEDISNMDSMSAELERQKILRPMRKGLCVYCNANYQDAPNTGQHWDRVLTNFLAGVLDDDDPHDMEFLHDIRSRIERRTRAPRTFLSDFRLMVQLHEGSGLSFPQITASNLLLTSKHPVKLEKEYLTYRRTQAADAVDPWTEELVEKLWKAVGKAGVGTTMTTLRRQLVVNIRQLSMLDLGNKLADRFLDEFRLRGDAFSEQLQMYNSQVPATDVVKGTSDQA